MALTNALAMEAGVFGVRVARFTVVDRHPDGPRGHDGGLRKVAELRPQLLAMPYHPSTTRTRRAAGTHDAGEGCDVVAWLASDGLARSQAARSPSTRHRAAGAGSTRPAPGGTGSTWCPSSPGHPRRSRRSVTCPVAQFRRRPFAASSASSPRDRSRPELNIVANDALRLQLGQRLQP